MNYFSEYLNKVVSSNLPSPQEKSLEDDIYVLNKNFCTKNKIINKVVETQNTVLITIWLSLKINIQTIQIKLTCLYHLILFLNILTPQSD